MIDFEEISRGPIFGQKYGLIAVVTLNIGQAMFLSAEVGLNSYRGAQMVLVGQPIRGSRFDKAITLLDLAPELRADDEERWFVSELYPALRATSNRQAERLIRYVDL